MKNTQVGMTNNFFILLNAIVLTNEAENTTFTTFHPVDINLLIFFKQLLLYRSNVTIVSLDIT